MRVCGIIAEYDPFHLGHLYHLTQARERAQATYVVAVIGCAFSQRGEAMLFDTHARARMALLGGADVVLGMPVSFSCAQANRFARGGVGILQGLGVVSHLSFGCEPEAEPFLLPAAEVLYRPSAWFSNMLKDRLQAGHAFAKAQGEALSACLPDAPPALFSAPNFILGLSYLLELKRLNSAITPVPIPRSGDYHAQGLSPLPSATAVRVALRQGAWPGVAASVPPGSLGIIREAAQKGHLHAPDSLDALLMGTLLQGNETRLMASPEMSEGLERRILAKARQAASREELLRLVKTRRYTQARISRAVSHSLLSLDSFPENPGYARLLGFRKGAEPLLTAIKGSGFPLIDRPGRQLNRDLAQDMRAEELWALGAGLPPASAWQKPMIILD